MNLFRRFGLILTLTLVAIFCLEQMAYIAFNQYDSLYLIEIGDLDSSNDKGEDQKEEKEIKEYKLQTYNSVYLESLHASNCARYGQLTVQHSLEVFLDIVTPPPEA
jgi:hypothetical protein